MSEQVPNLAVDRIRAVLQTQDPAVVPDRDLSPDVVLLSFWDHLDNGGARQQFLVNISQALDGMESSAQLPSPAEYAADFGLRLSWRGEIPQDLPGGFLDHLQVELPGRFDDEAAWRQRLAKLRLLGLFRQRDQSFWIVHWRQACSAVTWPEAERFIGDYLHTTFLSVLRGATAAEINALVVNLIVAAIRARRLPSLQLADGLQVVPPRTVIDQRAICQALRDCADASVSTRIRWPSERVDMVGRVVRHRLGFDIDLHRHLFAPPREFVATTPTWPPLPIAA